MTPFIPVSKMSALTKGSHQAVTTKLVDALKEQIGVFGGKPVQLVSVFADHVIVLSEAANAVVKVGYGIGTDGAVHFTTHTVLPIPVVTESNLRDYVRKEAKDAAGLFMSGQVSRANEMIAAIAGLVDEATALSDDAIVQGFLESREHERPWKTFVNAKKKTLMEGVLSDVSFADAIQPKFSKLYDGATSQEELPKFKGLVHADVATVLKRLSSVQEQVRGALTQIRMSYPAAEAENGTNAVLALETLATDLLSDVTQVKDFVEESSQEFSQVDLLAKVFDSVAAEVAAFEVAGAFAVKMATRLAEASR